jgi:hypothetical protein
MDPVPEATDQPVSPEEDNLERARRAVERLRAITFFGPDGRSIRRRPTESHPDALVRAQRAVDRLRAIRF